MSESDLSTGILKDIMFNHLESENPLLQVVEIRELKKDGRRYRAAVSDGQNWVEALCGTSMREAIIEKTSVITA